MIFDCFCFNGEKELLEIRMNEFKHLEPLKKFLPVKHVVVTGMKTFTGIDKPIDYSWLELLEGFDYVHREVDDTWTMNDPWKNERFQRDNIYAALKELNPQDDDIIIISDVDEIPKAYAIQHYRPELGLCALQMDVYHFYLNTRAERQTWTHPRIMPWSYLKDKMPDEVRRGGFNLALVNAGWHFTWQGGIPAILNKFKSFSHQEEKVQAFADPEMLETNMRHLRSIWGDGKMEVLPDIELPYYVQRNKEKFKHMIYAQDS